MSGNIFKKIIKRNSRDALSRNTDLAERGLNIAQDLTMHQEISDIAEFLDSVGGIPDNNMDPRFREINNVLRKYFSQMSVDEIVEVLKVELQKRPNGRTLKLLGFAYFYLGEIDKAIEVYKKSLAITTEDPVAIYESLGRSYILKGDLDKAKKWFAKSYRYDFEFFLDMFGWEFLYVTAVGHMCVRPPIFGEEGDEFSMMTIQIESMADALSITFGNKPGHKSLSSGQIEHIIVGMAREYAQSRQKAIEAIENIRYVSLDLFNKIAA